MLSANPLTWIDPLRLIQNLLGGGDVQRNRLALLENPLETQLQRQAVMEVAYRTGQGSTATMLGVWQRTEELRAAIEEMEIEREQGVRALEVLCRDRTGLVYGAKIQ